MQSPAWMVFQLAIASSVAWLAVGLADRRPSIGIVVCMFFAAWAATRFAAWLIDLSARARAGTIGQPGLMRLDLYVAAAIAALLAIFLTFE